MEEKNYNINEKPPSGLLSAIPFLQALNTVVQAFVGLLLNKVTAYSNPMAQTYSMSFLVDKTYGREVSRFRIMLVEFCSEAFPPSHLHAPQEDPRQAG